MWLQLPSEIWWKILVASVVDTAMLSESPSSLNESMINHALVCRSWSEIVHQALFLREAKSLLYEKGMLFSWRLH